MKDDEQVSQTMTKLARSSHGAGTRHGAQTEPVESLYDAVIRQYGQDGATPTLRQIARAVVDWHGSFRLASAAADGEVSHNVLNSLTQGRQKRVLRGTMQAMSRHYGLPMSLLKEASGLTSDVPDEPFTLPSWADDLTARSREAVVRVARDFYTLEQGHGPDDE